MINRKITPWGETSYGLGELGVRRRWTSRMPIRMPAATPAATAAISFAFALQGFRGTSARLRPPP